MGGKGNPKKKKKRKKKNTKKERKRKETEQKEKQRNKNGSKHALRAQAESLGGVIPNCWYDQSCAVSSRWTNIRTTREDQTEVKTRGYTEATSYRHVVKDGREQPYVQLLGQG